jgi:NADPH-dependent curcumin reductase CurA
MQGFIVFDYRADYASGKAELVKWFSEGKIKSKETIITGGLPAAEDALVNLFKGVNTGQSLEGLHEQTSSLLTIAGKLMVEIKNPEQASKL